MIAGSFRGSSPMGSCIISVGIVGLVGLMGLLSPMEWANCLTALCLLGCLLDFGCLGELIGRRKEAGVAGACIAMGFAAAAGILAALTGLGVETVRRSPLPLYRVDLALLVLTGWPWLLVAPVGLGVAALVDYRPRCPQCGSRVFRGFPRCRVCQAEMRRPPGPPPGPSPPGPPPGPPPLPSVSNPFAPPMRATPPPPKPLRRAEPLAPDQNAVRRERTDDDPLGFLR
jgi:hypothetical protein